MQVNAKQLTPLAGSGRLWQMRRIFFRLMSDASVTEKLLQNALWYRRCCYTCTTPIVRSEGLCNTHYASSDSPGEKRRESQGPLTKCKASCSSLLFSRVDTMNTSTITVNVAMCKLSIKQTITPWKGKIIYFFAHEMTIYLIWNLYYTFNAIKYTND